MNNAHLSRTMTPTFASAPGSNVKRLQSSPAIKTVVATLFACTLGFTQVIISPVKPPVPGSDGPPPATLPAADAAPLGDRAFMIEEARFAKLFVPGNKEAQKHNGEMVAVDSAKHYLSLPRNVRPPFPSVLMLNDGRGIDDHSKLWADRLAASGFVVLLVDLYNGKVASTDDEAIKLMQSVSANLPLAEATLQSAFNFLAANKRVEAKQRCVLGFGFGGELALQFAIAQPLLSATAIYYSRPVKELASLQAIQGPILSIFGTKDTRIPLASIDAFSLSMQQAGRDATVLRYDAERAFMNPADPHYEQAAASLAWHELRAFLTAKLTNTAPAKLPAGKAQSPAK